MVDFHSHILPGIDDGSKDIQMTKEMLKISSVQGVDTMIATPHFYADRETIARFLAKRAEAYDKIAFLTDTYNIRVILGAEVAFFPNMGRSEELKHLTIEGTSLMLLEMPFRQWESGDIKEIQSLLRQGIVPIIAHVERFIPYQRDKRYWKELYKLPLLIQVNGEALVERRTRSLALKLFKKVRAHLLGSDCHNLTVRVPNLQEAREILEYKLGEDVILQMDRLCSDILFSM